MIDTWRTRHPFLCNGMLHVFFSLFSFNEVFLWGYIYVNPRFTFRLIIQAVLLKPTQFNLAFFNTCNAGLTSSLSVSTIVYVFGNEDIYNTSSPRSVRPPLSHDKYTFPFSSDTTWLEVTTVAKRESEIVFLKHCRGTSTVLYAWSGENELHCAWLCHLGNQTISDSASCSYGSMTDKDLYITRIAGCDTIVSIDTSAWTCDPVVPNAKLDLLQDSTIEAVKKVSSCSTRTPMDQVSSESASLG